MKVNLKISLFVYVEQIIGCSDIGAVQLRGCAFEKNLVPIADFHLQDICKTAGNIFEIQAVKDIAGTFVPDKEILFYGHSRLEDIFIFPDYRPPVIQIDLYGLCREKIVIKFAVPIRVPVCAASFPATSVPVVVKLLILVVVAAFEPQ